MKYTYSCTYCNSTDVETIESARFDPNNDYTFIEMVECGNGMDWCNTCNAETAFDENEEEEVECG